jgi:hypothetical protein
MRQELAALESDGSLERVQELAAWGRAWGYQPEREQLSRCLAESLERLLGGIGPQTDLAALLPRAGQLLDAAAGLGLALDLWEAQNHLLNAYARQEQAGGMTPHLREAFAALAGRLGIRQGLLGWRP